MAGTTGQQRSNIAEVDALIEQVSSVDFVAMVRLLENLHVEKPRVGTSSRVSEDIVRLSQHVTLGFRGTSLQALEKTSGQHEYRLFCNFMGLLGSNGPMPLHYTEYADQRARHHNDPTFKEFLDIFNQRMLCLFYRACVQFDPMVNLDRPRNNNFHEFAGALSGIVPIAASERDAMPDAAKHFYVGWLATKTKSPDGLVAMVQDYFQFKTSVKEFAGDWLNLPLSSRSVLGVPDKPAMLGSTTYIGKRVWGITHRFVLSIGPLDWSEFNAFKPGSRLLSELKDLVRNYLGDEWAWELELQIEKGEARTTSLNRHNALGFSSFLGPTQRKVPSVTLGKYALGRKAGESDWLNVNTGVVQ